MSKQQTVQCPTCKGSGGKTVQTVRDAVDSSGKTIKVYGQCWERCTGGCNGAGQIVGGGR